VPQRRQPPTRARTALRGVAVHSSGAGQAAGRSGGLGLIEGLAGPYASALERPPGRETAPPSRQGGAGRRPAGAFTRPPPGAPRARGCGTSPLAAGAGPAAGAERLAATRPHLKPRHRLDPPQQHTAAPPPHTHRAETPEPLEPPPTPRARHPRPPLPLPLPAFAPAASPRVASTVHPLDSPNSSTTHPIFLPRTRCRRPASGPSSIPPRLAHPGLPGRSRKGGPARSGGPPFLAKPRREAKETPEGGAAACCAQGRNP
jgi:hypothetical protein